MFQTVKVTLKVIQGHWRHSIGHIRFPIATMSLSCTVKEILSLHDKN